MNVAELLTIPAEMFPQHEILRFEGTSLTYADLCARVAADVARLGASGIGRGGRVAVLEANTPRVIEALYATTALGGVFVPLNFRVRGQELGDLLATAGPSVLLAGSPYRALAEGTAAGSFPVLMLAESLGVPGPGVGPVEPVEADAELAVLMFTSGTSARPKGVMLGHVGLVDYVLSTTDPADGSDRGSVLVAAPIHHIAGLTAILTATFGGRRIVLMRQFDAEDWLRLVEAERVTHAFVVPTMLKRILDHPRFLETDLSSLQVVSYGAAPMPLPVIRRAIEELPAATRFINAFGQTETTSTVSMLTPEDHRLDGSPAEVEAKLRRLASIGRPVPDVELRVVDEAGRSLAEGEVGEIVVRTPRLMAGYDGARDESERALRDGWLWTGDLAWTDEAGYVFLAGRASDMIIRGGENIAPQQVEAVLESHTAVDEAAVVGIPDEEWGERVVAAVIPCAQETTTSEALIAFCRERMAGYKRPERIVFVDALPRTPLGKVIRREVRMLFDDEKKPDRHP